MTNSNANLEDAVADLTEENARLREQLEDALSAADETWHETHAAQFLLRNARPLGLPRSEWAARLCRAITTES